MEKTTYTIIAKNSSGASMRAGVDMDHINGGKRYTSINNAAAAARRELGSGWKVEIIDNDGRIVKEFTIR